MKTYFVWSKNTRNENLIQATKKCTTKFSTQIQHQKNWLNSILIQKNETRRQKSLSENLIFVDFCWFRLTRTSRLVKKKKNRIKIVIHFLTLTHSLADRLSLTKPFSVFIFVFALTFLQTFRHISCLSGTVEHMQHCGHSIYHFSVMMMMATMVKWNHHHCHHRTQQTMTNSMYSTKINIQKKHTKQMVMRTTIAITIRPNQEHVFLFKVVPVPVYSIPPISKMQRVTIIRCLAAIWVRCSI